MSRKKEIYKIKTKHNPEKLYQLTSLYLFDTSGHKIIFR